MQELAVMELEAASLDREAWARVANIAAQRLGCDALFTVHTNGAQPPARVLYVREGRLLALTLAGAALAALADLLDDNRLTAALGRSWAPVAFALLFVLVVWIARRWVLR